MIPFHTISGHNTFSYSANLSASSEVGEFSHRVHITHSPRCSHTRLRLDYLKQEGEPVDLWGASIFSFLAMDSDKVKMGPLWSEVRTIPSKGGTRARERRGEATGGLEQETCITTLVVVEIGLVFTTGEPKCSG